MFQWKKVTHRENIATEHAKNVSNNYPFLKNNKPIASLKEDIKVEMQKFRKEMKIQ